MTISLDKVGKRYGRDWIFRNVSFEFTSGNAYAVLGPNGSGKSTFLQLIAGNLSPTEGTIQYTDNEQKIESEDCFRHLTLCTPYLQIIEELTLSEQLDFHFKFKRPMDGITTAKMIELLSLDAHAEKQLRYFSSGMKQRVKLCLAILSDVPVILLDEPATNLDAAGVKWYRELLNSYLKGRLLIVSSNRQDEYEFCNERLNILEFKQ